MSARRQEFAGQWRRIGEMIRSLALALQYAHNHGVLHRDLKPGNILFDAEDQPCIADFGLAKLTGEASVLDGSLNVLGTPAYLAPEIAEAWNSRPTSHASVTVPAVTVRIDQPLVQVEALREAAARSEVARSVELLVSVIVALSSPTQQRRFRADG